MFRGILIDTNATFFILDLTFNGFELEEEVADIRVSEVSESSHIFTLSSTCILSLPSLEGSTSKLVLSALMLVGPSAAMQSASTFSESSSSSPKKDSILSYSTPEPPIGTLLQVFTS